MDWYTSDPGRPKFSPISDTTFWKMISFETKWIAFVQNRAAYCLVCILLQKQCSVLTRHIPRQHDMGYAIIRTLSIDINPDLYKHSDSSGFVFTLCGKKATWSKSCFNKIKFLCTIIILCDIIDNFFNHINQNWSFDCDSFPLLR